MPTGGVCYVLCPKTGKTTLANRSHRYNRDGQKDGKGPGLPRCTKCGETNNHKEV